MAKSMFNDIGAYKNTLLAYFSADKDILSLVLGDEHTDEQEFKIIYTQMFPFLYVEDVQTEKRTYICVEVDPIESNSTIKKSMLTIWAYCHKDIMEYYKSGYEGTRVDVLSDIIDRKIRDSDEFGIGSPSFKSALHFTPESKFYGRQIFYIVSDFRVKEV